MLCVPPCVSWPSWLCWLISVVAVSAVKVSTVRCLKDDPSTLPSVWLWWAACSSSAELRCLPMGEVSGPAAPGLLIPQVSPASPTWSEFPHRMFPHPGGRVPSSPVAVPHHCPFGVFRFILHHRCVKKKTISYNLWSVVVIFDLLK